MKATLVIAKQKVELRLQNSQIEIKINGKRKSKTMA